jgi:molybdenum cofactor synthesis domain-containing protein
MTDPDAARQPTAAMIVIGDEVLSGRTRDINTWVLAQAMTAMGIRLAEARIVPDETPRIVAAVRELSASVDHVFTSGGIGPTHDDITADAMAEAFGASIGIRGDARAILEAYYEPGALNDARLRMARIPDGATLILNPVSQAPGFRIGNVHVMAGVPAIFAAMLDSVKPTLTGGAPTLSHALRAPLPEGEIAVPLGAIAAAHPRVSVGSYPFFRGGLGTTLVARATDRAALDAAVADIRAMCATMGVSDMQETAPD